jgi:CheY-like chemotaxis protein
VDAVPPGSYVRLSVRDNGAGIQPEHLPHVFEPFFTTKEVGQGTGLGLATVHGVVTQSQGHIRVESRPGEGSHFWIDLVLDRAPDDGLVGEPVEEIDASSPVQALVAEDDPVNQMLIVEMLRMLGCSVDVVADGDAARRAAAAGSYDIVFMDCHMPVTDGFDATRGIREDELRSGARTVIVAVTADALAGDQARCIEAGMDAFLTKPVSTAQLSATIERWTGHRTNPATQW